MKMTVTDIAAFVSVLLSLGSLLSVFYIAGVKLATLQVKVDTMWEFTLRRGKSEALREGLATMNSPIIITDAAMQLIAPIGPVLMELYSAFGPKPDAELALEIERRAGDILLHKICIPNGLYLGACLFMAIEYIKRNAKTTDTTRLQ